MPIPPSAIDRYLCDDPLRLVDVGARGGIDERWRRFESLLTLTAFEPDPEECRRLNSSAASLPYPARFLPNAIWRQTSELPFYVCKWPVASSVYPPNEEFLQAFPKNAELLSVREQRTVSTIALDEVSAAEGVVADHLKVDVEGAELDVLIGGERLLSSALVLEVEVEFNPIFRNQPLFAHVDDHLRERGWTILGLRRNSWRQGSPDRSGTGDGGQLVSADALYLNGRAIAGDLSASEECKLLVILAAYRMADAVQARLHSPGPLALSEEDRSAILRALTPSPGALVRVGRRLLRRLDGESRRRIADRLQAGDAPTWHDPGFF